MDTASIRFRGKRLVVAGDRVGRWSAELLEHEYHWRTAAEAPETQANRAKEAVEKKRFFKSRNTGILTIVAFLFGW